MKRPAWTRYLDLSGWIAVACGLVFFMLMGVVWVTR